MTLRESSSHRQLGGGNRGRIPFPAFGETRDRVATEPQRRSPIRCLGTLLRVSGAPELHDQTGKVILNESPDLVRLDLRVLADKVVPQLVEIIPRNERIRIPEGTSDLRGRLSKVKDSELHRVSDLRSPKPSLY